MEEPEETGAEDPEELPEFDFADPLKREPDEQPPGLDPAITIPPED